MIQCVCDEALHGINTVVIQQLIDICSHDDPQKDKQAEGSAPGSSVDGSSTRLGIVHKVVKL